ncbi:helix-turn-helix domain-containing protein [Streptomyces halobius]|uniref:Helix-turn-helix transcriptional regulator n=1 Tax=Streptomyces halobius TaxID=2879846 RepID=A0ABY4ME20_9ACTN|nr:helix-turn-helix transcriptional regulator [Streptomyces halobius]UQA95925.1 helix-turn-helix transcriptional regulator [Streptomyces halobius]
MKFTPQELTPYVSARHYFGSELRRHRESAKLSLAQLADILNSSKSTLARIERADLMPPPDLPAALDAAFGTDKHFYGLYQLARKETHPDRFRRYMEFHARAEAIEVFETQFVPGLLQTEAYARALLSAPPDVTREMIEERVQARLDRQEQLHSAASRRHWAILDEAILCRPVGGSQVMHAQLNALLSHVDTPTRTIQVLPFEHGEHALMAGPLALVKTSVGQTVAWEEGHIDGRLFEDPAAVNRRVALYDKLRAYALSPRDSAERIRKAMERHVPCE